MKPGIITYEVLTGFLDGFENCWTIDGEKLEWSTKGGAFRELANYLEDYLFAIDAGDAKDFGDTFRVVRLRDGVIDKVLIEVSANMYKVDEKGRQV